MWVHRVQLGFLLPLRVLLRPLQAELEVNLTFLGSFHFLIYLRSLFKLPIWKIWQLENGPFSKWEVMFPRTNIAANRSWSNSVCRSHCISFRWHFWHIHLISDHFIIKNKVLSYHGWNSEKRSTVANCLYFPSNKIKYIFVSLFILRIFHGISNFWKASQP